MTHKKQSQGEGKDSSPELYTERMNIPKDNTAAANKIIPDAE